MVTVKDCRIITLPKILDQRGNLSFAENYSHIPFEIQRTYWLYDVPGGVARGGHAEINNEEIVIALSGSFEIMVDDGTQSRVFTLNRSYYALYIPKGLWREIREFSTNALALEMGSIPYSIDDYINNYDEYVNYVKKGFLFKNLCRNKLEALNFKPENISSVYDCSIIHLDTHHSERKGNLSVIENGKTLPYNVKRVYYLYDVPGGESRGAHAHKELSQLIVAASGSFEVTLDDGINKRSFFLNRPYQGLYIKPGIWRNLSDFSSGSVCMVLASDVYKASDYIRSYEEFLLFRGLNI